MPRIRIQLTCPLHDSFRVRQIAGMFDLFIELSSHQTFEAELPDDSDPWQIGLIVGPSGGGKTTLARRAWPDAFHEPKPWPADRAMIDCFGDHPIKQIVRTLTAVGFSSPPAWLKPHAVLSTGERFRCELAKCLLARTQMNGSTGSHLLPPLPPGEGRREGNPELTSPSKRESSAIRPHPNPLPGGEGINARPAVVFDEFTSVVDRTVAKLCSYAISKAIRSRQIPVRFVAVTCHQNVRDWLAPDWVIQMPEGTLTRTPNPSDPERLRRPSAGPPDRSGHCFSDITI